MNRCHLPTSSSPACPYVLQITKKRTHLCSIPNSAYRSKHQAPPKCTSSASQPSPSNPQVVRTKQVGTLAILSLIQRTEPQNPSSGVATPNISSRAADVQTDVKKESKDIYTQIAKEEKAAGIQPEDDFDSYPRHLYCTGNHCRPDCPSA